MLSILGLMPHFKCEMSVFMGQLWRRVRIAVGILCLSWHMGHPSKAMKYITCRVMSFRPWQASCVLLRGLSRLHSPYLSPPPYSLSVSSTSSCSTATHHIVFFPLFYPSAPAPPPSHHSSSSFFLSF